MKHVVLGAGALALVGFLSSGALAAQKPASCTLVVKGKSYIEGECQFEADPDGSFRITGKDYFAYVNMIPGTKTAEASWNADPKATHAHAALGTLTRKGACWENADAKICARALTATKAAAAVAAQPKGEMIYPDYPGASQSCIIARGSKWVEGAQLVLAGRQPLFARGRGAADRQGGRALRRRRAQRAEAARGAAEVRRCRYEMVLQHKVY